MPPRTSSPPAAAPARVDGSAGATGGSLLAKVGGKKGAMIGGAVLVGAVALYRKHKASTAAANASANDMGLTLGTIPSGYSGTATDPGQVYTGWDQLEAQIQALQQQLNNPGTAGNKNPPPPVAKPPQKPINPLPPVGVHPPSPVPSPPPTTPGAPPPAPPPGQRPVPSPGKPYTVVKGDTLWDIAKRDTGNGLNWQQIYNDNRGVIGSNPDLIKPGEKLIIP